MRICAQILKRLIANETCLRSETLKDKYENNLKTRYDDPAFEVVSILFRVLAAKKVTTPGNFQS